MAFGGHLVDSLIDDIQERLDDVGIEVGGGAIADDLQRLVMAERVSVGAIGGEGIVDVSYGEDAGGEWDVLTTEAVGIPGAIPALMVVFDDWEHGPGELYRVEDCGADLGV